MRWIFIFVIGCFSLPVKAQFTNVLISASNSPEEVSICVNPQNTNQIVAGANIDNVYYSNNSGLTWTTNILTDTANGVWGDPCVFVDTAGNFYYVHLSWPVSGAWIDRIVCTKSTDGGITWNAPSYTGLNGSKKQDKAWTAVNPATNEIYMTWTQFDNYGSANPADSSIILFSKSTDGGATWSIPKRINAVAGDCIDSDNTVEGAVPTVGPNGEIYVAWSGTSGIVFTKSLDGGNTWLPSETFVTATPGGWDYHINGLQRCNGLPITSCDISGSAYNGTIYINWTDQQNGSTDTDVWIIKSTDGGASWSSPIGVNDDGVNHQQFLTWMSIDQSNGYIYCVFYDRRNFSSGDSTDVYLARSTDGGNTFTNYQINQTSFLPSTSVFFGDYIGISASHNVVRPIWMALNGSALSAWTALVDGVSLGVMETSHKPFAPIELSQNRPNPFNQTTLINFVLKNPAKVSLRIYDVLGKLVKVIYDNEKFNEGSYDYILNASNTQLNAGVYYYSLSSEELKLVKEMVIY